MRRKGFSVLLAITLSLLFLTPAWAVSANLFKDTTGQWWEQSISECSAADIVGGRGNGVFAPKDSVSRLEAIVMLNRSLGFRNEADTYDMAQGGYNFPTGFPEWGKKNVAFAADKGFISKAGIPAMKPKEAANRAEIAVLFANALKLSADGYQLNFVDNAAIKAALSNNESLYSLVAAAVKHGVMTGKTGNKFDPNANITRGEMAAIIARLFENGEISPKPSSYFIARLSSVDTSGNKITVVKDGQTQTYSLQTDALLYREGKRSTLSTYKANENIKIILDAAGKVIYIAYTTATPSGSSVSVTTTYTGTIKGLISGSTWMLSFQPDSGRLNSYPLLSTVKITQSGLVKDLTALTNGARAEIKVTGGSVSDINLLSSVATGNEIKGYIVNMYLDYFTIHYDNGTSEEINKSTVTASIPQIYRGQRVAITKSGNILTSIVVLNEAKKIFGEVVNIGSSSITIEDDDGYERTVDYASGCKFRDKDDDSIDREDIEEEDSVEIELNTQEDAVIVKLTDGSSSSSSSSNLEGEVTDVDASGDWSIKIEKADGSTKSYDVDDDVDVYDEDGDDIDFDDIQEGDYVKLKLNSSDDVTRIDILDVEIVEGEVADVDTSGDWSIEIEKSSGSKKTYDVSDDVDVYDEDGDDIDFDDIMDDDEVKLIIDNDEDEVITINILDESNSDDDSIEGIITGLDIDRDKITIKDGSSKTYTLSDDVTVERDGKDLDLDEILIGSEAEITLDDDEVEKIEITDDEDISVEGELKKVYSSYIILKQDNGDHKLYFADDVDLEDDDGDDIDEDDLGDYEGDDVTIELKDGDIDSLEIQ